MPYESPHVRPEWWSSDLKKVKDFRADIDGYGFQWAECEEYVKDDGDESVTYYYCDLKGVLPDGSVVTYGRYFAREGNDSAWMVVIPPGVYAYSGYEVSDLKGYVKDGRVEYFEEGTPARVKYEHIISADAVILGR